MAKKQPFHKALQKQLGKYGEDWAAFAEKAGVTLSKLKAIVANEWAPTREIIEAAADAFPPIARANYPLPAPRVRNPPRAHAAQLAFAHELRPYLEMVTAVFRSRGANQARNMRILAAHIRDNNPGDDILDLAFLTETETPVP
jgi:lambda repressor-like predicted transcriptional regulator